MKPFNENNLVYVIAAVALVALLWLLGLGLAQARSMSVEECRGIALDMRTIAEMRDDGKDAQSVAELVDKVLRPHLGEEGSYVQFETDISFMVGIVRVIYDSAFTPAQIEESAYSSCSKYGYGVSYRANAPAELNQHKLAM